MLILRNKIIIIIIIIKRKNMHLDRCDNNSRRKWHEKGSRKEESMRVYE